MMYSSQLRCQSRRARNAKLLRLTGLAVFSVFWAVGVFIRISPFEKKWDGPAARPMLWLP